MVSPTTALCFHIGEGLNKDSFVLIMHIVTRPACLLQAAGHRVTPASGSLGIGLA